MNRVKISVSQQTYHIHIRNNYTQAKSEFIMKIIKKRVSQYLKF